MVKSYLAITLVFILCLNVIAGYRFLGDYTGYRKTVNGVEIDATNGRMRLTFISPEIIRIQVADTEFSETESYTVMSVPGAAVNFKLKAEKDRLLLEAGFEIVVHKRPLRIEFLSAAGATLCTDDPAAGHGWDGNEVRTWKKLFGDEKFFGLGEKTGNLDKRGNYWKMWNSDTPGYGNRTDPLYQTIPFFIVRRNAGSYGIFFDNTYRSTYNLGAGNNRLFSFGAENGPMDYYFLAGPDMKSVIQQYSSLTGRMPLPPEWALGYQQCRWSYYPEYRVRLLAENFRQRKIPADVIYLDIHYMDRYKVFTWDEERFPNPEGMLNDLAADGFKVVTIVDPGVKVEKGYPVHDGGVKGGHFLTYPDGELFRGQVWPGWCYFPDFSSLKTRQWWANRISNFVRSGVKGIWIDMNEPAVWGKEFPYIVRFKDEGRGANIKKMHNLYAYQMARATQQGLLQARKNERPFILTRAGYAGIQKYAAVWTGDNVADWEHLGLAVRMSLGMGLSGVPFVGADVGGFSGSPEPELFARWVQVGSLMPLFRTHTHHGSREQEPWSFGEDIENNVRDYITLRYRLMPYLYSIFQEAADNGFPVMRPLFLEFETDDKVYWYEYQHQFMVGDWIMVAPVLSAGQQYTKIYLPEGRWLDYWSRKVYEGPEEIVRETPWWQLPIFYREGAIVPSREPQQYIGEKPLESLALDILPGKSSEQWLYFDDGISMEYLTAGFYRRILLRCISDVEALVLSREESSGQYDPGIKLWNLYFHDVSRPLSVYVDGGKLDEGGNKGWKYQENLRLLKVEVAAMKFDRIELRYE